MGTTNPTRWPVAPGPALEVAARSPSLYMRSGLHAFKQSWDAKMGGLANFHEFPQHRV